MKQKLYFACCHISTSRNLLTSVRRNAERTTARGITRLHSTPNRRLQRWERTKVVDVMTSSAAMQMGVVNITGAGIAGLTLARSLKNLGVRSVVFEKNPNPARHNYGITLQPWACQALLRVLNIDEPTFYQRVAVDSPIGGRGYVYEKYPVSPGTQSLAPLRAHCGKLERLLRESLDIKWGHVLQDVSRSDHKHLTLSFKDQDSLQSPLTIDTTGVHSRIRKSLLPQAHLNILPYVVFRGTRRLSGSKFKDRFKNHFKAANVIQTKKGGILLQIQINDFHLESEAVDISYIYSRPAKDEDQLHRPDRQTNEAENITEALFTEIEALGNLEAPFKETFMVEKMRDERILHWLMRDLVVPLEDLSMLAGEGVLLVGDSAHAMPILGGEGANFAITDAVDLADVIRDQGQEGILNYYQKKHPEWELAVEQIEKRLADMHHLVEPVYDT